MISADSLPHITASLNAASFVLILAGFAFIRGGDRRRHRQAMLAAVAVSAVFLGFYLVHHFTAPISLFRGAGVARTLYYGLLISHVVLAAAAVPMIAVTLRRAFAQTFDGHKALARWTFGIWSYVSASGVAVYVLLYHAYPAAS